MKYKPESNVQNKEKLIHILSACNFFRSASAGIHRCENKDHRNQKCRLNP